MATSAGDRHGCGGGVVSLVNGLGGVGAIVEGPLVGAVAAALGWGGVMYMMVGLSLIASLAAYRAEKVVEGKREEEDRESLLV